MFTVYAKNKMLQGLPVMYASLHQDFPTTAGLNELVVSPYARQVVSTVQPSGGSMTIASPVTFNMPTAFVRWIGFWDAVTGGNLIAIAPNGGTPRRFTVDLNTGIVTCPAHGFAANAPTCVYNGVPGGAVEGFIYSALVLTPDTLQLGQLIGSAPLTMTSQPGPDCFITTISEDQYAVSGTHTLSAGQFVL